MMSRRQKVLSLSILERLNCQSQNTEGAFLESFPLKKGGMVSYGIELPARGFSVLLPYRNYVTPSVTIGIYSSV